MEGFNLRTYTVFMPGFEKPGTYHVSTPAKARAAAYHGLVGAGYEYTFKDFLKKHTLERADDPRDFGKPILVQGRPAFKAGHQCGNSVPFVWPGKENILWGHELDVSDPSVKRDD